MNLCRFLFLAIGPVVAFWLAVCWCYPLRLQIARFVTSGVPWLVGFAVLGVGFRLVLSWFRPPEAWPALDHRSPQACGLPLSLALSLIIFSLPLVHAWSKGQSDHNLGGVLPGSDAGNYLHGARRLMVEGKLDAWNCRRPLNAAFLSVRLLLAESDFRIALLLQALLMGAAVFLLARVVASDLGRAPAFLVFVVLFAIGKDFVSETLSEALGLTLGALAAAVLWVGVRQEWLAAWLGGLFLLTVALDCRAGAFLTLPFLLVWSALQWRRLGPWINWKRAGWSASAVLAGFLVQISLRGLCGEGVGLGHGNFAHTLYGFSRGVADWTQIYRDYPQTIDLNETQFNAFIRERAWANIQAQPGQLATGLADGWSKSSSYLMHYANQLTALTSHAPICWTLFSLFFLLAARWAWLGGALGLLGLVLGSAAVYAFLGTWQTLFALIGVFLLAGGLRICFLHREGIRVGTFAGAALLGVALSAPLLADGFIRVYAASYPLLLVILVLALHGCHRQTWPVPACHRFSLGHGACSAARLMGPPMALGVGIVVAGLTGPLLAQSLARPLQVPLILETDHALDEVVYWLPGSPYLEILSPGTDSPTWSPQVRHKDLLRQLGDKMSNQTPVVHKLAATNQPFSMILVSWRHGDLYLVGPSDLRTRLMAGTRIKGCYQQDSHFNYLLISKITSEP